MYKKIISILLLIPAALISAGFCFENNKIKNNIYINGIDVSNLSKEQAYDKINSEIENNLKNKKLRIKTDFKIYDFYYPEIAAEADIYQTVGKAFDKSREKKRKGRIDLDLKINYYLKDIKNIVDFIIAENYAPPQDAQVFFYPDSDEMFSFKEEKYGYAINEIKLYSAIAGAFKNNAEEIRVTREKINPDITQSKLEEYTHLRAKFHTCFESSTPERKSNIRLSLSSLSGRTLKPGDTLSFNECTGRRTEANGYKSAKIILDGELAEGIGGGVCQSSTTFYNAALLAGLTIIKQYRHTIPISYVPLSFDAMVNGGSCDLVVKNDTDGYVFIKTYVFEDNAYVEIYGEKPQQGLEVRRRSVIKNKIPPPEEEIIPDTENKYPQLKKGEKLIIEKGKEGYETEGYLDYYLHGKLIKSEKIRSDKYRPQRGKCVVGER